VSRPCAIRSQIAIHLFVSLRHSFETELRLDPSTRGTAQRVAAGTVQSEQLENSSGESGGIARRHNFACIAYDRRRITNIRHDGRYPAGHRLADDVWKGFPVRRRDRDIERRQKVRGVVALLGEVNNIDESKGSHHFLKRRAFGHTSTGGHEPRCRFCSGY